MEKEAAAEEKALAERANATKQAADKSAKALRAKIQTLEAPVESAAPAAAPAAPKKGFFGWVKGLFSPAIVPDGSIGKAEFKQMMKEGAANVKEQKEAEAEQALKDQSAALGELGIVAHNEAFGALGAERVKANEKEQAASAKKAAAEAKAVLTAGLSGKEAKVALGRALPKEAPRSAAAKQAERLAKKGDEEFVDLIEAGEDPEAAAAFLESARADKAKSARQETVRKAKKAVENVGVGMDKAMAKAWQVGDRALDTVVAKATGSVTPAERDQAVRMASNAGDQVLTDAQILAEQALSDRRTKQRKAEGTTAFSKKKPSYATTALSGIMKGAQRVQETAKRAGTAAAEGLDTGLAWTEKQLVGSGGLVEKAVQSTGRAGELVGKAADAALRAPVKAVEMGADAVTSAEDALAALGVKSWEAVKRTAEKLRVSDQDLKEAGVAMDMEDIPDEITEVVAEAAAERREGPDNFTDVFDELKALAESDNRARKTMFVKEANILEDLVAKNGDPNEYLGVIGNEFRGWTTEDVKKLVNRLYKTNLLAK